MIRIFCKQRIICARRKTKDYQRSESSASDTSKFVQWTHSLHLWAPGELWSMPTFEYHMKPKYQTSCLSWTFPFQAPLLLSSKDDKSARPIMVQSSLDYQSQLYESMSFNCHSPRNDKCLIFIFLISVGSHKSWRVLRLVTVRLHEILNLDAIAC